MARLSLSASAKWPGRVSMPTELERLAGLESVFDLLDRCVSANVQDRNAQHHGQ